MMLHEDDADESIDEADPDDEVDPDADVEIEPTAELDDDLDLDSIINASSSAPASRSAAGTAACMLSDASRAVTALYGSLHNNQAREAGREWMLIESLCILTSGAS